jgi:hypothetical protein
LPAISRSRHEQRFAGEAFIRGRHGVAGKVAHREREAIALDPRLFRVGGNRESHRNERGRA